MIFSFKIKKEQVNIKNSIFQIIDKIDKTQKIDDSGDIEITLKFEAFYEQTEFLNEIKKLGFGWNLS
jgi:hypothetical protein